MNIPDGIKYSKTHEWVKETGNGLFEIGISDFAQKELGDIVYVNLPQPRDEIAAEKTFADIESVKAVSDIFSPVTGTVKEVNEKILSSPESINKEPYASWFIRAEGSLKEENLLSAEDYRKKING